MPQTFICKCCRQIQPANPRCKKQEYCSAKTCQRERKRKWQANKMDTDPDYRKNQKEAYKAWCERNSDYWRKRREKKNLEKTALIVEKEKSRSNGSIKMDTIKHNLNVISGEYLLIPTNVKMDTLRVKIVAMTAT